MSKLYYDAILQKKLLNYIVSKLCANCIIMPICEKEKEKVK